MTARVLSISCSTETAWIANHQCSSLETFPLWCRELQQVLHAKEGLVMQNVMMQQQLDASRKADSSVVANEARILSH